jgi:carbon storage regulator CsrA
VNGSLSAGYKEGDVIRIGDDIEIRVLEAREGEVHLNLKVPKEIPIHRPERKPVSQHSTVFRRNS